MCGAIRLKWSVVLAAAFCAAASFADAVDTSSFAKKITLSVNDSLVEENVALSNFPVLVRLDASKVSYADFMQAGGADILFTSGEGALMQQLPYEIQTWDPSGESFIWVKLPELARGVTFDMYYSCQSAQVENTPSDVWSEYVSVVHYEEGGADGQVLTNSANSAINATAKGSASTNVVGVIGGGRNNFLAKCGIDLGATPAQFGIGGKFTFSTWLIHEGAYNWDGILYSGNQFAGLGENGGFSIELNESKKEGLYVATGNWNQNDMCYITFTEDWNGGWKYYAVSYEDADDTLNNNSAVNIYAKLNGEYKTGRSGWGDKISVSSRHIAIGNRSDFNGAYWRGSFDESRLRNCVSSEEWLEAERQSVAANALSYGAVETLIASSVEFDGTPTVVRNSDGTITVSARLVAGTGVTLSAVFNSTVMLEIASGVDASAESPTNVVKTFAADALPADTTWSTSVVGIDSSGGSSSVFADAIFMTGSVSVETIVGTAYEQGIVPGSVKVSRPSSAVQWPLVVRLGIAGTAVNGQTYEEISDEITFAEGEYEKIISVTPRLDLSVNCDSVVTLNATAGNYGVDGSTASVTIVNYRSPYLAVFSKMLTLTLNPDVNAFTDGKTLSGFPVLVRLRAEIGGFSYDDVQRADHGDIAFLDEDFNSLPYEIEKWNPRGESRVWVKVPTLTENMTLRMLYGSQSAAQNNPAEVWTAYQGVWHLYEAGERDIYQDSTANSMNGEKVNGRILITDPSGNVFASATRYVTVSMWVKPAATKTWQWLVNACRAEADKTWGFQFTNSDQLRFWNDQGNDPRVGSGLITAGEWVRFDCVYNGGSNYQLYTNGVLAATGDNNNYPNGQGKVGNQIAIGGLVDTSKDNNLSTAEFGEVRFANYVIPAEWFKATYAFEVGDCFTAGAVSDIDIGDVVVAAPPSVTNANGVAAVALPLVKGTGDVYAIIHKPDGTTENRLMASAVTGPSVHLLPIADISEAEGWYDVGIRVEGKNSDYAVLAETVRVCTAPVWVHPGVPGVVNGDGATFIIGRSGSSTTLDEEISIKYELDGVVGVAVIPAGNATAQVVAASPATEGSATLRLLSEYAPIASVMSEATVGFVSGRIKPRVFRLVVSNYSGNEVADFPALVRLEEGISGFSYEYLRDWTNGSDIKFTLRDGTVLPHEVDYLDAHGESCVWVKLPNLVKGAEVLMHVGGESRSDNVPSSVWSGQTAVWHVNYGKEGSAEGKGYYANVANSNVATMRAWDSGNLTDADGKIGAARRISNGNQGASGSYFRVGGNALMAELGNNFTTSMWFKYKDGGQMTGDDRLASHKAGAWDTNGWEISLHNNNPKELYVRGNGGNAYVATTPTSGFNSGDWHHVAVAYNGTDVTVYVNGTKVTGTGSIQAASNAANVSLTFGGTNSGDTYSSLKGVLDEIRLGAGSLSADRIKADYETVANDQFFRMGKYTPGFAVIVR